MSVLPCLENNSLGNLNSSQFLYRVYHRLSASCFVINVNNIVELVNWVSVVLISNKVFVTSQFQSKLLFAGNNYLDDYACTSGFFYIRLSFFF